MLIVVCEDNAVSQKMYLAQLRALAKKHGDNVGVQGFSSADDLFLQWDEISKDVGIVYMDIVMPGTDGIEAAKRLRANGYNGELVFLTASDEHWEEAFWVDAAFYIVKGVTDNEKFESIYTHAVQKVMEHRQQYFTFTCAGESVTIRIEDILYFEVMSRIMTVHYANKTFNFYTTMGKLQEMLFGYGFLRVHRSFLVARSAIRDCTHDTVLLINGEEIPLGRMYQKEIRAQVKP